MKSGDVVAERFRIDRLADEGGMGAVYRGLDRHTGEPVAIKVLHTRAAGGESESRFAREADVLADLRHPGVVRHISHGQTDEGRLYLVMEWLAGVDLSHRLNSEGLTLDESVRLVRSAADALGEAHAKGIVHRDVKPSNLFLVDNDVDKVKLLDFGVARVSEATITLSGITFGTPGYMAPEQARGDRMLDARADVFALGCVLFECLTGQAAFHGEHLMAVLAKILLEDAPRVREVRPEVPRPLDRLVARMLMKDPAKRPRDGSEVVSELDSLGSVSGNPSTSTFIPPSETSITPGEQRLLCVVLAGAPDAPNQGDTRRIDYIPAPLDAPTLRSSVGKVDGFGAPPPPTTEQPVIVPKAGSLPVVPIGGLGETALATPVSDELLSLADPARAEMLNARAAMSAATAERLRNAIAHVDARVENLADGSLIATLTGGRSATDQVAQAARCALAMRAHLPDVPIVVTTGRGVLAGKLPVGKAIDRAAALMRTAGRAIEQGDGRIEIDDVTAGLLDARFDVVREEEHLFLRRERDLPDGHRVLLGRPTPLVGRNRELLTLEAIFAECVEESVSRAVVVTGPAGIGKSRLCYEFIERLASREDPVEVWVGRGDPLSAGSPFHLLAQALRRHDGVEGESVELRRQKLRERVAKVVGKSADASRISEFLGELVGVPFADDDSIQLRAARQDAMLMGDQMRRAWEDFLDASCDAQPVVLVLEDLHWGDLPSIKLVDAALRHLREKPLLVVALARPEVHEQFPNLWSDRNAQELRLGELSRRASEKLIKHVLGDGVSQERLTQLADRAEGNAFYLEELLRAVSEGREELPETVLAMVQARVESLGAEARWVLRASSIYGRVFWKGGTSALLGGAESGIDLDRALSELIDREIVVQRGASRFSGEEELAFQHDLIREAAYAMLTEEDSKLGHRLAADWLIDHKETDGMVLAEHCERGGDIARAAQWFGRAAEQALEGNDFDAAVARAARGLSHQPSQEQIAMLELVQAEALRWAGSHAQSLSHAERAFELAPRHTTRWYAAASEIAISSGRLRRQDKLVEIVAPLCEATPNGADRRTYIIAAVRTMVTLVYAGLSSQAGRLAMRVDAMEGAISGKDPTVAAVVHRFRATQAMAEGDPSTYLTELESAATCFELAGDLRNTCNAKVMIGHARLKLGGHEGAIAMLEEALAMAERLGLPSVVALAKHNLGLALALGGAVDKGRNVEGEAIDEFASQGDARLRTASLLYAGIIELLADDAVEAARLLSEAAEAAEGIDGLQAHALAALADAELARERLPEALRAAEQASDILERRGTIEEGEALIRLADISTKRAAGQEQEAKEAARIAVRRIAERAAGIRDPAWQASFRSSVPEHARTLRLARELGVDPGA